MELACSIQKWMELRVKKNIKNETSDDERQRRGKEEAEIFVYRQKYSFFLSFCSGIAGGDESE